ncbi:hypothetical protein [Paenirhodobacter populi]|uniref:TnsA endonuclease N-terminal domain-containing protein n=1 Tax=Paenirhodobacter populi TaxID=2306993 RepID=A0A443JHZ0_9RHOB|nr:hypothetical protein [Sinirhodobacter populi]RWR20100.1 hypothetical protein D2T30_11705 [Sinirhodobacter populi]
MTRIQGAEVSSGVTLPLMSRATRRVPMRSRFSCRGWTVITRRQDGHRFRVQFESLLELLTIQMAATLQSFIDLIEQPFEVPFVDAMGKPGTHHIDLLVVLDDGRKLAIAVKPAAKVTPKFREVLAAVKRYLPSDLADDLILVTDQDFTRAQAQNALRYIEFSKRPDVEADDAVTRAITSTHGIVRMRDFAMLTGLAGRGYRAAFRAAFRGQLEVLTDGLINQHTLVKARAA